MLQRSYFVSSVPVINPDHPALPLSLSAAPHWMVALMREDPSHQIQHKENKLWVQFIFMFFPINKSEQLYLERYFWLRKEITFFQDFVTSSCPEMPKMFPQMCPGLWYLRNLITNPDYVKSGQTLTCVITMTRDSQPICTFLPRSPPLLCYLCIWILMAGVSSVVIWVSSGAMIHHWHQIDWDHKQTENHFDMMSGLIIIADQLWEIYIRGKQDPIM